jgi:toxin ParE1/3/4
MSRVVRRPAANRDLVEAYRYYAREAGRRVADRFFARSEETFQRLASLPGSGAVYEPAASVVAGLRYFPIAKFPDRLVFYRPIEDGVEIYRVLHGARDLEGLLESEDF